MQAGLPQPGWQIWPVRCCKGSWVAWPQSREQPLGQGWTTAVEPASLWNSRECHLALHKGFCRTVEGQYGLLPGCVSVHQAIMPGGVKPSKKVTRSAQILYWAKSLGCLQINCATNPNVVKSYQVLVIVVHHWMGPSAHWVSSLASTKCNQINLLIMRLWWRMIEETTYT